jgi:hypothetical protein
MINIKDYNIKYIDFGYSTAVKQDDNSVLGVPLTNYHIIGSQSYIDPIESLYIKNCQDTNAHLDIKYLCLGDFFSLCIVLFDLITLYIDRKGNTPHLFILDKLKQSNKNIDLYGHFIFYLDKTNFYSEDSNNSNHIDLLNHRCKTINDMVNKNFDNFDIKCILCPQVDLSVLLNFIKFTPSDNLSFYNADLTITDAFNDRVKYLPKLSEPK